MTKLERLLAKDGLFIGAHRGFSALYPENTLLSVQQGVALGVDLVEVDVYLSHDGVPVIAHDCQLERCSNGTGNIHDYTLKELKTLDFGRHRGEAFEGLHLPTLEQFLAFMSQHPDVLMNIDFKVYDYTLDTVKTVLPMIEQAGMMGRCVFNCIDCDIVSYLTQRVGRRVIGAPHDYPRRVNFHPGEHGTLSELWGICIPYTMLDDAHVELYRQHDIAIICTPADTPEQVARAMHYQVTMPLCNDPRAYLRAAGR